MWENELVDEGLSVILIIQAWQLVLLLHLTAQNMHNILDIT